MDTGISPSYPSAHSLSENHVIVPESIGEDENSIISWYHHGGEYHDDGDEIASGSNYDDFIDIDMLPDTLETVERATDNRTIDPVRVNACLVNFKEILLSHRRIFRNNSQHVINMNLNENDRNSIVKSKANEIEYFASSQFICCYYEGLSALLQIFNRLDCSVEQFSSTINDCHCFKQVGPCDISQIRYALDSGGYRCQQCSIDYIIENLNTKFLVNVARAQFITVRDIIDSIINEKEEEIELGATSNCFPCHHNGIPYTGWLRRWLTKYLDTEAVVAIIYSEIVNDKYCDSQRYKIFFRIIDYSTDEEFHLTIPMESVKDEELEKRLLEEEKVYVLRSDMMQYEHRAEEFESLLNHPNERVHDMNVLGQIVGMFREQTVENFRDVSRPRGIHRIKVPNMHRHGVLVVLPLSTTLPSRDIITDDPL